MVNKFPHFMETGSSMGCFLEPATSPHPTSDEFGPFPPKVCDFSPSYVRRTRSMPSQNLRILPILRQTNPVHALPKSATSPHPASDELGPYPPKACDFSLSCVRRTGSMPSQSLRLLLILRQTIPVHALPSDFF